MGPFTQTIFNRPLEQWFKTRDFGQCLGGVFSCHRWEWEVLSASSGWWPGLPLYVLQCTGHLAQYCQGGAVLGQSKQNKSSLLAFHAAASLLYAGGAISLQPATLGEENHGSTTDKTPGPGSCPQCRFFCLSHTQTLSLSRAPGVKLPASRRNRHPPPPSPMDWALARMLSLDRRFELENKIRPFSLTFSVPFHLETLWFSSSFRMNSDSDLLGNAQPTIPRTPLK